MYKKSFRSNGEHFTESSCASWMKTAFPVLDEIFGEHSKICTTLLNNISEDGHLKCLREKYGYVPSQNINTVTVFRGLTTEWYSYHRATCITHDGFIVYEIGYRFDEDTDEIRFRLMLP